MDIVLSIFIYSLLITLLFSISVAIAFPLFKDYYSFNFEGFFPMYNLFKLCSIVGYNEFIAFLYIIPGLNIVLMILTGMRLKNMFETYSFIKIGLMILPIIFIPLAAYIKYNKPSNNETYVENDTTKQASQETPVEVFDVEIKPVDNVKITKTTSQVENVEKPKEETIEDETNNESSYVDVDDNSIFKIQTKKRKTEEDNKPYRAKRIKVNEQFINSAPAEQETIKKVDRKDD